MLSKHSAKGANLSQDLIFKMSLNGYSVATNTPSVNLSQNGSTLHRVPLSNEVASLRNKSTNILPHPTLREVAVEYGWKMPACLLCAAP